MFGKKKNNNPDKLNQQQKFGLNLISSIAGSLDEVVKECEDCPRSVYALEVENTLAMLNDKAAAAYDQIKVVNTLPFSDMQEVSHL